MDSLALLVNGFMSALDPMNLLFALVGCIFGTLVGILPGFGPSAGTAILIPLTFAMSPTAAIIMLSAIYYGAMYGGTITSVLLNTPGEAASAITCVDGYQMARNGRAGAALGIAAIGSFTGAVGAILVLALVALPLSRMALYFGPPEFFALMVLGLAMVTGLAGTSMVRALISATLGLIISLIGIDPTMGIPRFTFGVTHLLGGVDFVPVVMGMFGISEILSNVEKEGRQVFLDSGRRFLPSRGEFRAALPSIARGTGVGVFFGFIPGVGAVVPSFLSYVLEKKVSRHPERFGKGAIEGVAGPETANNAYVISALIPLFTLGIPGSATMAILMGALMMNGLIPGPFLFVEHAGFVWTIIASLFVGNLILLVLNLPLIPLWTSILKIPYSILFTLILAFCVMGSYCLNGAVFDTGVMLISGLVGYVFCKLDIPLAPLTLTLILGPLMEQGLRLSLELSNGRFEIFLTRPLALGILILAACFIVVSCTQALSSVRGEDTQV